ncbi:MAG: type II toxin-antitoxin system prevent-host-death family antitoxin [Acidobacteriia bacterium]|nr:type II toxin-antitoxin system prevent-host-death family antitoxin [Terriglobia bacterium]
MKANILDLRYRTKDVLKAVERGETVTVFHRGKAKARIVPEPAPRPAKLSKDGAFGMWKNRKDLADVPDLIQRLRKGRSLDL